MSSLLDTLRVRTNDSKYDVRPTLTKQLVNWVETRTSDIPNTLFYGPRGSGKKSLVSKMLQTLASTWKMPLSYSEKDILLPTKGQKIVTTGGAAKKGETVRVKQSLFTFEIDVDDMSLKDKLHLPAILEMLCGMPDIRGIIKIVVLHHLHRLGEEAQFRLANAIHEYGKHTRFICTMEPCGPLEHLITSEFVKIPIPAFTSLEIKEVVHGISPVDKEAQIISMSAGNMSLAVLFCTQTIFFPDENPCDPIATTMKCLVNRMRTGDFTMLATLRVYAATLMEHHIPFITIIDEIMKSTIEHPDIPEETKMQLIDLCKELDWTSAYRRFLWLERTLVEMFRIIRIADVTN